MNLKFLPIGSICLINNTKHMIVGYNQNNYEYVSVLYPEGINQQMELHYFNHADIVELFALGYKGNEWIEYNSKILSTTNDFVSLIPSNSEIVVEPTIIPVESKYEFDETGTVVSENKASPIVGLQFDENGVVIADSTSSNVEVVSSATSYEFDENGVVVGDWTTAPAPEKREYVYDENGIIVSESTLPDIGIQSYQYDENGIVVGDWTAAPALEKREYVYDENGIVISDGMNVFNQPKLDLQYDESGVIISDGNSSIETNVEPTLTEETPVQEEIIDIQFDENGMVITNEPDLDMTVSVEVPFEDTELSDIEIEEEPKKEEKKKKGFFGFGR